jgi:hypothetical protein
MLSRQTYHNKKNAHNRNCHCSNQIHLYASCASSHTILNSLHCHHSFFCISFVLVFWWVCLKQILKCVFHVCISESFFCFIGSQRWKNLCKRIDMRYPMTLRYPMGLKVYYNVHIFISESMKQCWEYYNHKF